MLLHLVLPILREECVQGRGRIVGERQLRQRACVKQPEAQQCA